MMYTVREITTEMSLHLFLFETDLWHTHKKNRSEHGRNTESSSALLEMLNIETISR